jgi:arylformamidase
MSGYNSIVTEYLDVTVPLIPGLVPLYPGDTDLDVQRVQARREGGKANVSKLTCSLHCGTHVDAPVHFFDGLPGIETVPLDVLIGPAWVVDASSVRTRLDAASIEALDIPAGVERVLFRTRNSALWDNPRFVEDFVCLSADGADVLVRRGVRLVGIDYLSIAPYQDPAPAHEILFTGGVTIVETLDLRRAAPGPWQLTCLPLLLPGADGAPARAVLSR